jgi:SAM-dependent methyltransferase
MSLMCLNLGCGKKKIIGAVNLDISPDVNPDVLWDLNQFPYPFKECKFDLILASHILEHLNDLTKTIDELWRILKVGGILKVWTPYWAHRDAYANPSHKHFFSIISFDFWDSSTESGKLNRHEVGVAKFRKIKAELHFAKPLYPTSLLVRLINADLYERYLANIFPASEIYFELEKRI